MNLEEQVNSDFVRARLWALLRRVGARFHKGPTQNRLLSFDEVRKASLADNRTYLGTKIVEAEKVVGSVGRQSDFDRAFLPIRANVEARWRRVDRAFRRIEDLPPVSLYKVGEAYFVLDGHHRVSVPRYHGVEWIDAVVTEFGTPSPSEPARPRTIERRKEHTMPDKTPEREDPTEHEDAATAGGIEVRWGMGEDEARLAELMELNGMRQALAFEERFVVADRDGKILAALRFARSPSGSCWGSSSPTRGPKSAPWQWLCMRGPGSWRDRWASGRCAPVRSCTPTTIPTKRGIAGGTRVAGIWTRRGPSTAAKSCLRADGGGWSLY